MGNKMKKTIIVGATSGIGKVRLSASVMDKNQGGRATLTAENKALSFLRTTC
jgi:hypothetical protein